MKVKGVALIIKQSVCKNCGEVFEAPEDLFAITEIPKGRGYERLTFLPSYPREILRITRSVQACPNCFIPTAADTQLFLFPEELKAPEYDTDAYSLDDFLGETNGNLSEE